MPKFYLTTAIDYSNGDPHLGHALEKVGADCIARYRRLRGDDVHFLMGMDEHSQAVIQAAEQNGVSPQEWVDRMAATFETYWRRLECSNDDWIRTTEPRHHRTVAALLERIARQNPDDLFVGEYEGLYCFGCEEFKQPSQIVNGHCIEHPTLELVPTKERNHFFRLSRYRDQLLSLIRSGEFRVEPAIRRNEVVRLLEDGLQDISVSREPPVVGHPLSRRPGADGLRLVRRPDQLPVGHRVSRTPGYERLWPADLHVIGKGITRFHCVIWPAMLLAPGVALPREVWAHGYVQWEGAKMSKTAGTAVSLDEAIERHGPDALRYFLLREVGFEADGNFTWERFDERYTADLADGLGNLASRSLAMLAKYRDGVVPAPPADTTLDQAGRQARRGLRPGDGRAGPPGGRGGGLGAGVGPRTCTSSRWRPGPWPRPAGMPSWTTRSPRWRGRSTGWRCWLPRSSRAKPNCSGNPWGCPGGIGSAPGRPWTAPPVAGLATNKPEVLFPKPARSRS